MNYREAMAATVQGDWVRHDKMQPGSYIAHSYSDGPRINFPSGSSSGWTAGESDREADWTFCGPEVVGGCANCHGIIGDLAPGRDPEELCDTCYDDMQAANVGKWGKPPADLPPGHYDAALKVNANGKVEIDMVKLPAVKDKWGRLTNAPD